MKQINDIPVRRRPQSKDVHPGDAEPRAADPRADQRQDPQRPPRQIWDVEQEVDLGSDVDVPAPQPARPRSTPLILRNSTPADDAPAVPPEQAELAPQPEPTMPPVAKKRAVSRPRAAEPAVEPAQPEPRPQSKQMRPRSRPIMPPRQPDAQVPSSPPAHPTDTPPVPMPDTPPPQPTNPTQVNRAKTRILGFHAQDAAADPMSGPVQAPVQDGAASVAFPAGWIVVVDGPGLGASFSLGAGVSTIGRAEDQAISLDFGDMSVSRSAHASVAYDEESNKFYIGHGGKSNVVRRNGSPVLATEELASGDLVRIGKTTLRFVALCGADFSWANPMGDAAEGSNG